MSNTFIDITGLLHWYGPPVGIVRCQQQYALYARKHVPGAVFTAFDPDKCCYRPIHEAYVDSVIEGGTKIYAGTTKLPVETRVRFFHRVPKSLRGPYFWLTRFRRKLLLTLEQKRIDARSPEEKARWAFLQEKFTTPRHALMFHDVGGRRIDVPNFESLVGPPITPAPGDKIVAIQFDWSLTDVRKVLDLCAQTGTLFVSICHDIIPIKFPEWFAPRDVESFKHHFNQVFAEGDLCIFTTQRTAKDVREHCKALGIGYPDSRIVPLGVNDLVAPARDTELPAPLQPKKFALFVSTIEPRKNHRMLANVWRRLVEDGAARHFKLVFVGRNGWLMDDFPALLERDEVLSKSIVHLQGIDDAMLATLYREAAFCLYPPIYEGYGLPPVEALRHGKALLASGGGPIPEVVGDFAVCLDPLDEDAWFERIRAWLTGSDEPNRLAERARKEFRAVTWEESARLFFEAVKTASPRNMPARDIAS